MDGTSSERWGSYKVYRQQGTNISQHFFLETPIQVQVLKFISELRSLKLNIAPKNRQGPKRKFHLPSIIFQGRAVEFWVCVAVAVHGIGRFLRI